jgi:hypothetical protein
MPRRSLDSEWASAEEIEAVFGLSKGVLQKLWQDGQIMSVLIKTSKKARKGVRRFSVKSVRQLFPEVEAQHGK